MKAVSPLFGTAAGAAAADAASAGAATAAAVEAAASGAEAACAKLALDKEGRFLGLDVRAVANMGAYLSTMGPVSSTNAAGTAMGGVYDIPAVFVEVLRRFLRAS